MKVRTKVRSTTTIIMASFPHSSYQYLHNPISCSVERKLNKSGDNFTNVHPTKTTVMASLPHKGACELSNWKLNK